MVRSDDGAGAGEYLCDMLLGCSDSAGRGVGKPVIGKDEVGDVVFPPRSGEGTQFLVEMGF